MAYRAFEQWPQNRALRGFLQEPVRAKVVDNCQSLANAAEPRQNHRRRGIPAIEQGPEQFEAVQPRHDQIGDDNIHWRDAKFFKGLFSIRSRLGDVAQRSDDLGEGVPLPLVVIDHQDPVWQGRHRNIFYTASLRGGGLWRLFNYSRSHLKLCSGIPTVTLLVSPN